MIIYSEAHRTGSCFTFNYLIGFIILQISSRLLAKIRIKKSITDMFSGLSMFAWDARFLGETEGVTKGDVIASGALLKSLECDDGNAASGCCGAAEEPTDRCPTSSDLLLLLMTAWRLENVSSFTKFWESIKRMLLNCYFTHQNIEAGRRFHIHTHLKYQN